MSSTAAENKRSRDQEEQLQSLQFQQRSAAARALERLKKTETLNPIDQLVLLFNLHFQRRDTPSYRIVADSPLRVLHPKYFEFVSPSEWVAKNVPEEDLPELLIALDDIVESHKAVLGTDWDIVPKSNPETEQNKHVGSDEEESKKKPKKQRDPHAPTADGMVGWGDEDDEEEEDELTFSNLLGDEAANNENVVFAATEEERSDVALEAFWGLVAEFVEATIKYHEVRDALSTRGAINENLNNVNNTGGPRHNPLFGIFSALSGSTFGGRNQQHAIGKDDDVKVNAPAINCESLGPLTSAPLPSSKGSKSHRKTPESGGREERFGGHHHRHSNHSFSFHHNSGGGHSSPSNTAHVVPIAVDDSRIANFHGYHKFLTDAAALVSNIPISELSQAQRYLASMAAIPTTSTGLSSFFGPQAHFIYRIALCDCAQRLAKFHLDCFVRLYRKGRVGGDPADPIVEAAEEADAFVQHLTKDAVANGLAPPSSSELQKSLMQWQHHQYQLQYCPQALGSATPSGTAQFGLLPTPSPAYLPPRSYELPPIPPFAIAEAEVIRQKRLDLLNQRGRGANDTAAEFLRNGFGVDYIPTEEDFIKAMMTDGVANTSANAADDGIGVASASAGGKPGANTAPGASGQPTTGPTEGETIFKEEIHDYYISHLSKRMEKINSSSATAAAIAANKAAGNNTNLLLTPDGKPRFIKPVRYCRVKTGYVWNAYNRAKYSLRTNEKPPQVVQWYEFTLHYPLLANTIRSPQDLFRVELTEKGEDDDHRIIVFSAGPPYADVAYKIVNEQWDRRPGGVRCSIDDRGRFRLFFRLASTNYRR